jgi:ubiquitin-like modifier-activating enzyme ATG7
MGFWAELARRKLDSMGLSEAPVRVSALYTPAQNAVVSSPAQLDAAAFPSAVEAVDGGVQGVQAGAYTRSHFSST